MVYETEQAYYFSKINVIGGIESHLYYLAKKYGGRDWCVLTKEIAPEQLEKLRKLVRVIVLRPEDRVKTKRLFVCYERSVLEQCEADEVYFVIHSDYRELKKSGLMKENSTDRDERITKYLSVSRTAAEHFNPDIDIDVVYEPIVPDKHEEPVFLISATRLTFEKGMKRMRKLADELDRRGVNYLWDVYTDRPGGIDSSNVRFMAPRSDITQKMSLYDGLVQLSDFEAYCLTVGEALAEGVPVIATDLPVFDELKIDDRFMIRMPLDMNDIESQIERIRHLKDMKKEMPRYVPVKDGWGRYITKKKRRPNQSIKVEALSNYFDIDRKETVHRGQIFEADEDRAYYLAGKGLVRRVE